MVAASPSDLYDCPVMDDIEAEAISRLFYRLDGWERFWPYEQMPAWLAPRYQRS